MKIAAIVPFVAAVHAFADTAALSVFNMDLGLKGSVVSSDSVSAAVEKATANMCSSGQQLTVIRVPNLQSSLGSGEFIKHVHYPNAEAVDLKFSEACDVVYSVDGSDSNASVVVMDVAQVSDIDHLDTTRHLIVQGIPSFGPHGIEYAKQLVDDTVHLFKGTKRSVADIDEANEELVKEVEEEFAEAESFIKAESETESHNDVEESVGSMSAGADKKGASASGLFTKYQYFSPGLWSCIIVSLLLVFVLYVALTWVMALEISYLAFDKQVDYEKKNE